MKRSQRIWLEILMPAPLGTAIMIGGGFLISLGQNCLSGHSPEFNWPDLGSIAQEILIVMCLAYVFAGAPSLIFALVMEGCYSCGLRPRSWRAVVVSSLLGLVSGIGIVAMLTWPGVGQGSHASLYEGYGGVGLSVGFLLGAFIRWRTRVAERQEKIKTGPRDPG